MVWVDLLVVLVLIVSLIGAKTVSGVNCIDEEYLSVRKGKYLRAIFSLLVIFHHLAQRVTEESVLLQGFEDIGYFSVAVFYFLSGYGLQKSHINSEHYREKFLRKRLPKILIPYAVITVLYWIENALNGVVYSLWDVAVAILRGLPIVSFSWYIVSICCIYVAYWLIMRLCGTNYKRMLFWACIWYAAYIGVCCYRDLGIWWLNTPHLFLLGLFWATWEQKILEVVKKYYYVVFVVTVIGFAVACIGENSTTVYRISLLLQMAMSLFVVLIAILLSLKIKGENRILALLGNISMELYLLHGLWITGLRSQILYVQDDVVWCFAVVFGSIVSAWILHEAMGVVFKWMNRCRKS